MQFIIFLNRFDKDKSILEEKLVKLGVKIISEEDDSLLVECSDVNGLLDMQEIAKVIKIYSGWKPLNFKALKEGSLNAAIESKCKSYKIQTKFLTKIKISAKSIYKHINPYLKHEGFSVSEDKAEVVLYIEFAKENDEIMYRISYALSAWYQPIASAFVNYSNFAVVIENPTLVDEVSDFLRLCWIFKIPLYILTSNRDFDKLLKKAQEITKGIDYSLMKLNIVDSLPNEYSYVGFSKLARENEKELKEFFVRNFDKDGKDSGNKKMAFVFGDDKFGMSQGLRDKMEYMFRLTPDLKKPLRGSHALSYVLGIYSCLKL